VSILSFLLFFFLEAMRDEARASASVLVVPNLGRAALFLRSVFSSSPPLLDIEILSHLSFGRIPSILSRLLKVLFRRSLASGQTSLSF